MKQFRKNFFGKVVMFILATVMTVSVAWMSDGEASVAYASGENYYFTEIEENGVTITQNMTAPKPTTLGKETYIFAGYYEEATCETPITASTDAAVYKKFVPAELMAVKAQVTKGTTKDSAKTDMRLVTTVDSLNYKEVGFDVYYNGATTPVNAKTTTVYERIVAATEGNAYGYSPEIFDVDSEYFTTVNLVNIANKNYDNTFFIKPYWKTLDGTKVYGVSRIARVSDSYNDIANVPVRIYADNVDAGAITVTYDKTAFEYEGQYDLGDIDAGVTVVDNGNGTITCTSSKTFVNVNDMLLSLRFKINATASSNERFAMEGTGACDYLYKVLKTSYNGTSDTSWYDEFTEETEFVVSTPADLYGVAKLVNEGTERFAKKTIYMASDITINQGTAFLNGDGSAGFTRTDEKDAYTWNPIGRWIENTAPYTFDGTFNGNGHTISGIYVVDSTKGVAEGSYYGLFGATSSSSKLENFELVNSTFVSEDGNGYNGTAAQMGSIAGQISGDVKNVRSSAYVVSVNGIQVGGLAGRIQPSGATSDIENCWFDGAIYTEFNTQKTAEVGGLVGTVFNKGTVNITNCHNTGTVTCAYNATGSKVAGVAGFVGKMADGQTIKLNIKNSMNSGPISVYTTTDGGTTKTAYKSGVAGYMYNENYGSAGTGVYIVNNKEISAGGTSNVTLTNCITTTTSCSDSFKRTYKNSGQDFNGDGTNDTIYPMSTSVNCQNNQANTYYEGITNRKDIAGRLGVYTESAADPSLAWVICEKGMPQLKYFCDEWIDLGWYDNQAYVIRTAEELYGLSVISATDNFSGDTIYLGADIKMNPGVASKWVSGDATPERTFTPIGKTSAFAGTFDGSYDGTIHSISGLYINDKSGQGIGLFGQATGTIQNLKLENSCIFNNTSGKNNTGSIVGFFNGGKLTNVYSDAYVVSNAGAGSQATGGMVGIFSGNANTISKCWFDGEVASNGKYTGGIVGFVYDKAKIIDNCLNTGTVKSSCTTIGSVGTGGIVGLLDAASVDHYIKNSINMGEVSSQTTGAGLELGAVIGDVKDPLILQNVYTTDSTGGTIPGIGETVEDASTTNVTESTIDGTIDITGRPMVLTTEELTGENAYIYTDLDFGSVWGTVEDGTIVLRDLYDGTVMTGLKQYQRYSTGWYFNSASYGATLVDANTTYTIQDAEDFYGISKIVNEGISDFSGKTVQLQKDTEYDLNDGWTVTVSEGKVTTEGTANKWTPIGNQSAGHPFKGTFDGKNSVIKGVYVNASTTQNGLFGYAEANSSIKNFTLENSYFNVTADNVGSVVGATQGSLNNIYVKENVAVCNTKGNTGGLIGQWQGTSTKAISNCWFDGTVSSSGMCIGGMVGRVYSGEKTLSDCLFTGQVYNTVAKDAYVGGLLGGALGGGNISPSVYLTDCVGTGSLNVKSTTGVGSVVGRSITGSNATNQDRVDVHVENVYTTNALTSSATISKNYAVNGFGDMSYQYSSIYGEPIILDTDDLTGEQGYMNTGLNFEDTWVATDAGVRLATFAKADVTNLTQYQRVDLGWYYNQLVYSEGEKADGDKAYLGSKDAYQSTVQFEISDAADMYGLAALVNNTACSGEKQSFKDMSISLTSSVAFNNATQGNEAKAWYEGTKDAPQSWIPIGTSSNTFKGVFDGNENTISGVYVGPKQANTGLFGVTDVGSVIKNVRLVNSYFNHEGSSFTGSIAGDCRGSLENIYSDAIVESANAYAGGIVGRANGYDVTTSKRTSSNITNCWYDGVLCISQQHGGGIVGGVIQGEWTLTNCLFTGRIESSYNGTGNAHVGGICGAVNAPASSTTATMASKLTLNSCVSAGTITTANVDRGVGSVVGRVKAEVISDKTTGAVIETTEAELHMQNVFATRSSGGYAVGSTESVTKTVGGVDYTATPAVTGEVVWTHNDDRLIGYCNEIVEEGAETVALNYDTEWIIRDKGTPVPATFADLVTKVEASELDASIGLDVWNVSLSEATHYGVGRYVRSFGSVDADSKVTYELYINKLTSELGFSLHAGNTTKMSESELSGAGVDGVYNGIYTNKTGDWVLNVLYTENTGVTTITINTGVEASLSPDLKDKYATNTEEITLGMLQMTTLADNSSYQETYPDLQSYYYGASYVFRLANGHFIIIDGGNEGDYEGLIAYLQELSGDKPIYIDAWAVSHLHADHFSIMRGFYENPVENLKIYVEAFYINEPNVYTQNKLYAEDDLDSIIKRQHRGIRTFKTSNNAPTPVYWYQTGQRYYFNGITMDVIQSQEQIKLSDYAVRSNGSQYKDYNTTSTMLLFTTDCGQKILTGGDANYANMKYIMEAYGESPETLSNINVFTALHHGKNTSYDITKVDNTFTDYLLPAENDMFDVTLFPCSVYYDDEIHDIGAFPGAGGANAHLINKSNAYRNYGNGNVIVTLGANITVE